MSTFKDLINADIENVFLNADEFGEEHELNGTTCICVIQSPTAREQFQNKNDVTKGFDGLSGHTVVVHVGKESIPEVPAQSEVYTLDGEVMIVDSCTEEMGMLSITLHQNVR